MLLLNILNITKRIIVFKPDATELPCASGGLAGCPSHRDKPFSLALLLRSKRAVPKSLRKKGPELRQIMREGAEVFSMNGRLVRPDHSELSLFPLMETLHPFFVGVERLVRLGVSEQVACGILKEVKGSGKSPSRLDWRSPSLPTAIYQVMKDKDTQRWSTSLRSLFNRFGGLAAVRQPLYHLVFFFDPAEVDDLTSAVNVLQQAPVVDKTSHLSQMPLPANLHLVMVPDSHWEHRWSSEIAFR